MAAAWCACNLWLELPDTNKDKPKFELKTNNQNNDPLKHLTMTSKKLRENGNDTKSEIDTSHAPHALNKENTLAHRA